MQHIIRKLAGCVLVSPADICIVQDMHVNVHACTAAAALMNAVPNDHYFSCEGNHAVSQSQVLVVTLLLVEG